MRSQTYRIDGGPLAELDLTGLGGRGECLWRAADVVLAGVGSRTTLPVRLDHGGDDGFDAVRRALSELQGDDSVSVPGSGAMGFATLPFDRSAIGTVVIPAIVVGESTGVRFATSHHGQTLAEIEAQVAEVAGRRTVQTSPMSIRVELDRSAESWRDEVVEVARDRLRSTEMQKAVLARLLTLHGTADFSIEATIASLASRFDQAMLFAIDGFVGASPELLVSRSDRTVRAHPLAGTAARMDDAEDDAAQIAGLLASSKDRVEHRITIDWLLSELLPFCSYVDAEPEPSVLTLANVHHLGTLVEGVLSEPAPSVLELVRAVHPTPALGGAPQADALELIDELEGFDRGRYGGPSGWVDAAGNGQFAVSVRTAQLDGPTATIAAGVGVVAQSDPQSELIETQAKFRAMLGSLLR